MCKTKLYFNSCEITCPKLKIQFHMQYNDFFILSQQIVVMLVFIYMTVVFIYITVVCGSIQASKVVNWADCHCKTKSLMKMETTY